MAITVITHNGEMPKDGGIRLGYVVTHPGSKIFLPLRGGRVDLLASKPKSRARVTETGPVVRFADLRRAVDNDGECWSCRKYPNGTSWILTDRGQEELVKCSRCGTLQFPKTPLGVGF